jgi:fructokinase
MNETGLLLRQRGGRAGESRPYAGVELGGTKCVCTLAFAPDRVLDRRVVPTTTPDETLGAIVAILAGWRRSGIAALGIGSFGPLDLDGRSATFGHILATAKPGWRMADVRGTLAAGFDGPVGFDTDVNGAALAEMRWGAGQGLEDFAYVTVGTGIGVGLVVNGRPTRGLGHSEVGHLRVPRMPGDDAPSACPYHSDCVEGLASGTALVARLAGRKVDEVAPDDPVWPPIVHALAAMCHAMVSTGAPLRIALGGGVIDRQPALIGRIESALIASLGGYQAIPPAYLVPPELGAMAGPMGSIVLAVDALGAIAG